jgi:UDPglucose 6-dehydrogenase
MKLAVIGTGYVGLVSGTCFADTGNDVTCVDIDEDKVKQLQEGNITIYEPGLEALFNRSLREGRLHFTTQLEQTVRDAEIIFLCLPTPAGAGGEACAINVKTTKAVAEVSERKEKFAMAMGSMEKAVAAGTLEYDGVHQAKEDIDRTIEL